MAFYHLSESAQQDIIGIRDYTMSEWGKTQAVKFGLGSAIKIVKLTGSPEFRF